MIISREDYDRVMDPGKRDPVIEAARKETLARVAALRAEQLSRTPPVCPRCQGLLSDQTRGVWVCQTCKLK